MTRPVEHCTGVYVYPVTSERDMRNDRPPMNAAARGPCAKCDGSGVVVVHTYGTRLVEVCPACAGGIPLRTLSSMLGDARLERWGVGITFQYTCRI